MKDIISLAKETADAFGVKNVIIASIGDGANLVRDTFGTTRYRVIALGNTPQTDEERRALSGLQERGAEALLIERTLFQALSLGKVYRTGHSPILLPAGTRQCLPLPIRSARPASINASRALR